MVVRAAVPFLLAAVSVAGLHFSSDLGFKHENSPTAKKFLIETMGGGVALLDYDNDGRLDVFLVNSGKLPATGSGTFLRSSPRFWNRLYRQTADGRFTDVTAAAGLANAGDGNYGMGVATGVSLEKLFQARETLSRGLPEEPIYGHTPLAGLPKGFRAAA